MKRPPKRIRVNGAVYRRADGSLPSIAKAMGLARKAVRDLIIDLRVRGYILKEDDQEDAWWGLAEVLADQLASAVQEKVDVGVKATKE